MPKQYNYTMKTGRPTKYSESIYFKAEEYIDKCIGNAEKGMPPRVPWIEELAMLLRVDDTTLLNWANATDDSGKRIHPEFFASIKRVHTLQRLRLQQRTLGKSPTGSIFLLKANHGFKETTVIEERPNRDQDDKLDKIASALAVLSRDVKPNPPQQS